MEDAPLLVKKNMNGGDKCASCNQNIPGNYHHNSHCVITDTNNNLSSKPVKTIKTHTEKTDIIRNVSSTGNFHLPEVIIDKKLKTNANSPKLNSSPKKFQDRTTFTNSFKNFDELAERQLNVLIKDELDKNFVNPDKLLKASKKVFDTILEKKIY